MALCMIDPRHPGRAVLTAAVTLLLAGPAFAARLSVQLEGLDGALREAALARLELEQYASREVSPAQARRLYNRAEGQIQAALEPYGYYNVSVHGELKQSGETFTAVLEVKHGEPVRVTDVDLRIDGQTEGIRAIDQARAAFQPRVGQPLDHAAYERSKATVSAALFGSGYLDATLGTHRVEVNRSSNAADIHLA